MTTAEGATVPVLAGDWIISRGPTVVDTAGNLRLDAKYDTVHAGELTLSPTLCHALDDTLGLGSTRDPSSLLIAVHRLATIEIGTIRIPFTPGQLEELKHRAFKRGHSLQQELQACVDRLQDELFHRGG